MSIVFLSILVSVFVAFPSLSVGHRASLWYPNARATQTPTVPQLPGRLVAYCTDWMLFDAKEGEGRAKVPSCPIHASKHNTKLSKQQTLWNQRDMKKRHQISNIDIVVVEHSRRKLSSLCCWAQEDCMAQNQNPM